jgi:hypothetical protein
MISSFSLSDFYHTGRTISSMPIFIRFLADTGLDPTDDPGRRRTGRHRHRPAFPLLREDLFWGPLSKMNP